MDARTRFYFSRLNITGRPHMDDYTEKAKLIHEGLSGNPVRRHGYAWAFFDVTEVRDSSLGLFLHGFLGKYKASTDAEIALERGTRRKIGKTVMSDLIVAKSRFFLHVESGLIAFHPNLRHIQRRHFGKRFKELFEAAFGKYFIEVEVLPVEDTFRLLSELAKFNVVQSVEIYLHPANPRTNPRWKGVHNRLDRLGADSYTERYDAKLDPPIEGKPRTGGLNVAKDREIQSKIAMADDGYGRATATGIKGGQKVTISTSDNPVIVLAPDDEHPAEAVLDSMRGKLKAIFGRFKR